MSTGPIPTWFFVVIVGQRDDRILLVHECKHSQRWYFPAGRVGLGETIVAAAVRETSEGTGIPIRLKGLLRIEHTPRANATRIRVVLTAEPNDATPPHAVLMIKNGFIQCSIYLEAESKLWPDFITEL